MEVLGMTFCDNYTKALTLDEIEKIKNGRTYKKLLQLQEHLDCITYNWSLDTSQSIGTNSDIVWESSADSSMLGIVSETGNQ